jgi:formylmethanofuran dehydrogenase subunit D
VSPPKIPNKATTNESDAGILMSATCLARASHILVNFSTAIMTSAFEVLVKGEDKFDQTYLYLNSAILEELDSFKGDLFKLTTSSGRVSYFPGFIDDELTRKQVIITPAKAKSLNLKTGDTVDVKLSETLEHGKKVTFKIKESNGQFDSSANVVANVLKPFFEDSFVPVCIGIIIIIINNYSRDAFFWCHKMNSQNIFLTLTLTLT